MSIDNGVIGARVTYKWKDQDEVKVSYISLGEYNSEDGTDGFGIGDDFIFFYTDSVQSLEALKEANNGEDWVLLSIEELYHHA